MKNDHHNGGTRAFLGVVSGFTYKEASGGLRSAHDVLDEARHLDEVLDAVVLKARGPCLGLLAVDTLHRAELLTLPVPDRPECFTARIGKYGTLTDR